MTKYNGSEYKEVSADQVPGSYVEIGADDGHVYYVDPDTDAGKYEMSEAAWREWYANEHLSCGASGNHGAPVSQHRAAPDSKEIDWQIVFGAIVAIYLLFIFFKAVL